MGGEIIVAIVMTLAFIFLVIYHIITIYNQAPPVCPTSPICKGSPSRLGSNYNPKTDRVDALLSKLQHFATLLQDKVWCVEIRNAMPKNKTAFMKEMENLRKNPDNLKCSKINKVLLEMKPYAVNEDIYLALLDVWAEIEAEICRSEFIDLERVWDLLNDILDSFCPLTCK